MKLIAEVNTKLVDVTNEDTIIEELQDYSDGETEAQISSTTQIVLSQVWMIICMIF